MSIDHSTLTKGQSRKLNALRKSIGDDIAEDAFRKWMKTQSKTPKEVRDPVADALVAVLDQFKDDKTFRLGAKGYVVKRSKGKGASGFVAQKVTWGGHFTQTNQYPPPTPTDLSVAMLWGLLGWGQEGLGKGIWVIHRMGLSLRGIGSETTHNPLSLPILTILCQTSRMRKLTAAICLIVSHKWKSNLSCPPTPQIFQKYYQEQ